MKQQRFVKSAALVCLWYYYEHAWIYVHLHRLKTRLGEKKTTTKHFTLIQTSDTLPPPHPPPPSSFHPAISPQPLQINLQNIDLRSKGEGGWGGVCTIAAAY